MPRTKIINFDMGGENVKTPLWRPFGTVNARSHSQLALNFFLLFAPHGPSNKLSLEGHVCPNSGTIAPRRAASWPFLLAHDWTEHTQKRTSAAFGFACWELCHTRDNFNITFG